MASTVSPVLSDCQVAALAERGEERTAAVGDTLFRVGDRRYPFIVILEGEAAVLDAAGREIVRHGASGFLGEMNLLTGQTVFLTGVVTQAMRYLAVDRDVLRPMLFEDGSLADLLLSTFITRREALQLRRDLGLELLGPRSSAATRRIVEYAKRSRLPYSWRDPEHSEDPEAAALLDAVEPDDLPLVRLPGGVELRNPSNGEVSRALGVGLELDAREEVDLVVIGGGPAGLDRAVALEPGSDRHVVRLEGDHEIAAHAVVLATGAEYRRLPVAGLDEYEGISIFYAAGPPEAQRCGATRVGVIGGGNSAAQAAVWLARGGALVTLLHRRADLRETMSDYLIQELERYGVAVRGRSEVAELHGSEGELEAVTLHDGERLPFSFLFLFLGAAPCTDWLGDTVARDDKGFVLTGSEVGAEGLLETSVAGIYAAGDVRSGSIKRCATAVGEGAMVVRLVRDRLSAVAV